MEDKKIQVFLLDESDNKNENEQFLKNCYLKAARNEIVFLTADILREQFPAEENFYHGEFKPNCFAIEFTLISYFISIFEVLNNCVPDIRDENAKQHQQAVQQLKFYLENIIFFLDESEIDMIKPDELLNDEIIKLANQVDYSFGEEDEVDIEKMVKNIEKIVAIFQEMAIKISIELTGEDILKLPNSIKLHPGLSQEFVENFFDNIGGNQAGEYLAALLDLRSQVFITRILEVSQLRHGKTLWINMNSCYFESVKVTLEKNYPQAFEIKCFTAVEKLNLMQNRFNLLLPFEIEKKDSDEEDEHSFGSLLVLNSEESSSGDEEASEESTESFGNK